LVLTIFLGLFYQPLWPERILRASPIGSSPAGELKYYGVGRSATVLVLEKDGFLNLRTNGLAEASIDLKGAPPAAHPQRLLTLMPYLARPDAKDMLVIGYGGGVALEGIAPAIETIDVLELEPKVITANKKISTLRNLDPLDDPRINITINDARSALQLSSKKWDIIVSQPSHPWTAGASHLYTREFMQLAKRSLNDAGVFLQWMDAGYLSEELLQSLTKTLLVVYENVRVYHFSPSVLFFLASDESLEIEQEIIRTGVPFKNNQNYFRRTGIASVEGMLSNLLMDGAAVRRFSADAPAITDDKNLMATNSVISRDPGLTFNTIDLAQLVQEYSPVFDADSWIYHSMQTSLDFVAMGKRYVANGTPQLSEKLRELLYKQRNPSALTLAAVTLLERKENSHGLKALDNALDANPSDEQARFLLTWQYKDQIKEKTAPPAVLAHYAKLPPSAKAVIDIWPHAYQRKDFGAAVLADELLAQARTTDLWFSPATKLRVNWRIQQADADQHAQDALELIDEVIVINQDPDFYGMRIATSFLSDQPHAQVETVRRLLALLNLHLDRYESRNDPIPQAHIRANLLRLDSISSGLTQLDSGDKIEPYKLKEIRLQVEALRSRYQKLK